MIATAVATAGDFQNDLIGLAGVMPDGNSLVPVGIKGPTNILDGLNAMAVEQLPQLLQRHRHALTQVCGGCGLFGSQGAFEIVEKGQQVADECFFLRRGLLLGIPPGALLEIVKVGRETQVIFLLCGQLLLEHDRISRRRIRDWICRCGGRVGIQGGHLVAVWVGVPILLRVHGTNSGAFLGRDRQF